MIQLDVCVRTPRARKFVVVGGGVWRVADPTTYIQLAGAGSIVNFHIRCQNTKTNQPVKCLDLYFSVRFLSFSIKLMYRMDQTIYYI